MGSDILLIGYGYHKLWKSTGKAYPQKRESIYGRLLFSILSAGPVTEQKYSRYLINKTSAQALIAAKPSGQPLAE
jgi:hypothetical protein